jgi:phosphatidylinositol glycan class T
LGSPTKEYFDEQLTIKSLRDGKVASRFSFKTVLQGISPRNPQTLGADDVCAFFE